MTIRLRDWEIDLGELLRRVRTDVRYLLGVVAAALLVLCACGWLLYPRRVPTATVYLVGPGGLTLTAGPATFAGPGPHAVPAGRYDALVAAPGFYPATFAFTLTAGTTATLTPTLYPRPSFQEIAGGLPGTGVEAAILAPGGEVRFQVAVTATTASASGSPQPEVAYQWWKMAPDGRREHLLAPEGGPAAESADGRVAVVRPAGLFLADAGGNMSGPVVTPTADVAGVAWWGQDLLLLRATPTGAALELLTAGGVTPTLRYLTVLPALPDVRFVLPSPAGGYVLLLVRGRGSDTLLALDRAGRVTYLADLPVSPLPFAFVTWEREGVLLWTAPQGAPGGETFWPIYRLELGSGREEFLARPPTVRGLWVEEGAAYYLDGDARVCAADGRALYTMAEVDARGDFSLWRRGRYAVLYVVPPAPPPTPGPPGGRAPESARPAGRYWLLAWPGD